GLTPGREIHTARIGDPHRPVPDLDLGCFFAHTEKLTAPGMTEPGKVPPTISLALTHGQDDADSVSTAWIGRRRRHGHGSGRNTRDRPRAECCDGFVLREPTRRGAGATAHRQPPVRARQRLGQSPAWPQRAERLPEVA